MWLLSDFKSLQAAGLRVLFLAGWLPEFSLTSLPCASFFSAAPNMVACCFKAERKESHSSWQSLRFYVTFPRKWNPVIFVVSCWLEASHRSHLKWQAVSCTRVRIPGGIGHEGRSSLSSKITVCLELWKRRENISRSVMSNSLLPMDCRPPGSSVYRISQARILEWVVISFSRESSWSRDWTQVSCIAGILFTV